MSFFFLLFFRVLFTLSGVSKTRLLVVPSLFKCVPVLFVFMFVGCTLSAMDFVCIMSAYHCCVRVQVGFQWNHRLTVEDVNYSMIMCVYCIYFYGCIYMLSRIGKFAKFILSHGR